MLLLAQVNPVDRVSGELTIDRVDFSSVRRTGRVLVLRGLVEADDPLYLKVYRRSSVADDGEDIEELRQRLSGTTVPVSYWPGGRSASLVSGAASTARWVFYAFPLGLLAGILLMRLRVWLELAEDKPPTAAKRKQFLITSFRWVVFVYSLILVVAGSWNALSTLQDQRKIPELYQERLVVSHAFATPEGANVRGQLSLDSNQEIEVPLTADDLREEAGPGVTKAILPRPGDRIPIYYYPQEQRGAYDSGTHAPLPRQQRIPDAGPYYSIYLRYLLLGITGLAVVFWQPLVGGAQGENLL